MESPANIPFTIRAVRAEDLCACKALYLDGPITGKNADNDTGFDMLDIDAAYLRPAGNQLWVAQTDDGTIAGMIGVQQHDEGVGEIRRLRVAPTYRRRGIGTALVETAIRFCEERQYLKVKLDTFVQSEAAIRLFEKFHFHHERTRMLGEKQLMYFYLDLYSTGKSPPANDG